MADDSNTPVDNSGGSAVLERIYTRYSGNKTFNANAGMTDPSDSWSNYYFLDFYHVASKNSVNFMAFLNDYNETYDVNTTSVSAYGRADPIHTYRDTNRSISISWNILARSEKEAIENVNRLATLIKFLYPAYKPIPHEGLDHDDDESTEAIPQSYFSSATTLSKPPLVRVKYANIISNNITAQSPRAAQSGLLGFITSLNHSFDIDSGGFDVAGENGSPYILPKNITVTATFKPIHEHPIGWASDDNKWIGTDIDKHKIYENNQGPKDLDVKTSELPTFPFGIGTSMLNLGTVTIETPSPTGVPDDGTDADSNVASPEAPVQNDSGKKPIEPAK